MSLFSMYGHGVPATTCSTTTTTVSRSTNSSMTSSASGHVETTNSWTGWTSGGRREQTPKSSASNWTGMAPSTVSNQAHVQQQPGHFQSNTSQQQHEKHDPSLQDDGFKRPAPPTSTQTSTSSQPPPTDFTHQLLQFVGLPTNLANNLAPSTYEQKRQAKQKQLANSTHLNSVNGVPSHGMASESSTNFSPVVPKPDAPLPANLVEDIPVSRVVNSSYRVLPHKNPMKTSNSSVKVPGILRNTTSVNNSVKRMSLHDYKIRDGVNRSASVNTNLVKSAVNVTTPVSIQHVPQEKDQEGFLIPNASNITSNSKISQAPVTVSYVTMPPSVTTSKVSSSRTEISTPIKTSVEQVTSSFNDPSSVKVQVNESESHEIYQNTDTLSSDELDTSVDDELVIDESADFDKINANPKGDDSDDHQDSDLDSDHNDDGPYQTKSKEDINEISMELDELYSSLDTDGTLLMDHKMRKKLKKLLRRQKRREVRGKRQSKQSDSDEVKHDVVDENDDLDLDYPTSPVANSESDGEKEKLSKDLQDQSGRDSSKFKALKQTKNIVRKYRQREQRENERQKKRVERTPLSEGELSSEEEAIVKNDSKSEVPNEVFSEGRWVRSTTMILRKELDLSTSELDWVELMPASPNELQISFTVQASVPSQRKDIKSITIVKKTVAERSGSFRGKKVCDGELDPSFKDKKKRRSDSPRAGKSPEVIEIVNNESFLESGQIDNELSDKGLVSDGDKEKSKVRHRRRRRRRPSKQADKHSRSRSQSPNKERRHKKLSKSRSRSRSPHRTLGSDRKHTRPHNSQSPRRPYRQHRRSRSRSRSPSYERRRRRSLSRSPSRRNRRSHSISPPRRQRRSCSGSPSRRQPKRHSRSRSRTRSPNKEAVEKGHISTNDKKELIKRSRSRSKSPSTSKTQSQSVQARGSSANDTDFNSEDMDISSGNETPPLIIDPKKAAETKPPEEDDDADVSKQLEEAMEKLKKMEDTVNQRDKVIKDLEKGSDKEPKRAEQQKKSKDSTESDKTDEMDKQLIDAVERLQKMEENYSKRQELLNNLRQSILDAEKEAGLDVIELDSSKSPKEKDESSDEKTEVPPSTSSVHQPTPSTKPPATSSVPDNPSVPSAKDAPTKQSRWDSQAKKHPTPSTPKPATTVPSPAPVPKGNRIPSILHRRPTCPPPVVQRSSWNAHRPPARSPYNGPVNFARRGGPTLGPRPPGPGPDMRSPYPHGPPPATRPPASMYQARPPPPIHQRPPAPMHQRPPPLMHQTGPPPLMHQTRPPVSMHQTGPQAPMHQTRPPTPMHLTGPQSPMHQARPPAPMHQSARPPAPMNQTRPPAPMHQTGPPASMQQARPPAPMQQTRPPAPAQQATSDHDIVWLIGSSVLCQAARYVAQGPVGLGLMLNQAELVWHGHDNLKWSEFGPLLTRLIGQATSPNVLLVHMDALELAKVSFQDLAQQAVESLLAFNRRNPKCRIIWSETLPCCNYPGSIAKMTMEQVRLNYNVMCSKLVLSLGGQSIKHSAIRPETTALFDADRMHLSDLGNNIFLNNLRRGLAFLLSEPTTKVYCASDDRTF